MSARFVAWSIAAVGISLIVLFNLLDLLNGHRFAPAFVGTAVILAFLIVGALIAARQPGNPIGWIYLVAATFISFGGTGNVSDQYGYYALVTRPGALPAPEWVVWAGQLVLTLGFGTLVFFSMLLFPDGRLPSRRWRPLAVAAMVEIALLAAGDAIAAGGVRGSDVDVQNPIGSEAAGRVVDQMSVPLLVLAVVVLLGCVTSIFMRFRAARGVERQQLKWFAYGAAWIPAVGLLASVLSVVAPQAVDALGGNPWALSVAGIPVATAVAILRYRLYDVDVLIRRTLIYAALSVVLVIAYLAGIALFQSVLAPFTSGNGVAVAVSTLAVVALFQPVRGRIQAAVDRRFYRSKYDAERTLDAFAARLREQIDLGALERELLAVVDETLQPARASVWLREGATR